MKIRKVLNHSIVFDNDKDISFEHDADCCEINGSKNIILEDIQAGNTPFDADEVFGKKMKAYTKEKEETKPMIKTYYVNQPVKIQAVQWTGDNIEEIKDFFSLSDNPNAVYWAWSNNEIVVGPYKGYMIAYIYVEALCTIQQHTMHFGHAPQDNHLQYHPMHQE